MYLAKPVQFEQVALAVKAVQRRVVTVTPQDNAWQLDRRARQLIAPDGATIDLSGSHLVVMECFVEAAGAEVTREGLRQRLGQDQDEDASDSLNATIYRLRRCIERETPLAVPLQSKMRVGYVFRAPLRAV
jgi:two-component system, OmpR family, response regulator